MREAVKKLNAHIEGQGRDILVLSHGFGCDQTSWQHLMPWLQQRYRVIVYDLACTGEDASGFDLRRHNTLDGYVEDLLDLLAEMTVTTCTYIGHSVSGMIGLLAAATAPEKFEKVIAIGASARYRNDGGYFGGFDDLALRGIFDAIEKSFRDWARDFAPFVMGRDADDPATAEFTRTLISLRPDIALATAKTIFLGDWRLRLAECQVPSVILQSRDDPAVPLAAAEYLHQHLPQSDFELMETKGHLPHLSSPYAVSMALRRHLPRFQPLHDVME